MSDTAGSIGGAASASSALVSLLARTTRLNDLLPRLHQHALDLTGGSRALLFEHNPRNGALVPTSGFGLDLLQSDPWQPAPQEAAIVEGAFERRAPLLVTDADRDMPDLSARLEARSVMLLPLARDDERFGMLTVAFDEAGSTAVSAETMLVADAFITALELSRFRQRSELQGDLRQLLDEFSQQVSSTLQLGSGLDGFCRGANQLFGADRTSVWIHERRARRLVLRASSDAEVQTAGIFVQADELLSHAAAAMRQTRAEILPGPLGGPVVDDPAATSTVTVPLRGCRRALGTVVFEGVRVEAGKELDLLDRADEIGRQLSNAVESLELLDDVMRSRRQLEDTFDSIAYLVVVVDREGRILHANHAFAVRVGQPREQLADRPLTDFVGPDLAAWLADLAKEPRRPINHPPAQCEITDPVLNGPFIVTLTDMRDREQERVGSVIVARELTAQTMLETEREQLRGRLTQSEKLAALGQFVAGIAHELNNPLQGVLGHIELLRVTGAFPRSLRKEVQTIYREADRAAKIVRNLLMFAGARRVAGRPVSVNGVLQKVVALRASACRAAEIEVVRHYDEKLPRLHSDPMLLHQVFLNMIINAEHAVAAGGKAGRIEITTGVAPERSAIVVTIRDTGVGIAPDVLSHLFEPFYTTKEVGQGTGLGLAITYGIVQDHGGQVTAANHPEGGALFRIELPIPSTKRPRKSRLPQAQTEHR